MAQTRNADMVSRKPNPGSTDVSLVEPDFRPSYKAAALAGLATLILYIITLGPSTAMWDTSEYIAAAYVLGIPHPPGNPLFVLLGRVFALLPIAPNVAMRVNLLAAVCAAVSAGMWFLITERVLVGWLAERWQRIVGGLLAVVIGATAFTVWSQSVVNEKVYTVALVGVAIIAWLTVRWCDEPDSPKSDKLLLMIAFILGLGYSNHMAGFIAAPAVAAAVLIRRPKTILRWRLLLAGFGLLLLGLTPFATQPIRAAYFPAINEGEPTGCRTEFSWSCTLSAETWHAFKYNFDRGQYSKPPLDQRQASFTSQVGMWWLYFKWQWLRDPYSKSPRLQAMLGAVFLMLGLFGGYVHWKRDRRSFMFFGPLMFTMTLLLIYYLNFKLGASQGGALCDSNPGICEVRDRDYFFLWSFSAWSVWAALGLVFVWESLAAMVGSTKARVGNETVDLPFKQSWLKTSPVLAIALIPLFTNWHSATRAGETDTRDFAHDILNSVEPYGILVTVGDNDTFPLWYAQEVEGIRCDVLIMNTSLLNTDWYVRQMIRRQPCDYDKEKGPGIYRDSDWVKPSKPALQMTLDEADQIPLVFPLQQPMTFSIQGTDLSATIDMQQLLKADIVVLRAIQDAYPERPVYFSRTSGGYGAELGISQYLMTQGLAQKLLYFMPDSASRDTVQTTYGWMDLPRTKALWDTVFEAKASLIKKGKWIDFPSQGIPYLYVATGIGLFDALETAGRLREASSVLEESVRIGEAVKLDEGIGGGVMRQLRAMLEQARMPTESLIPIPPAGSGGTGPGGGDGGPAGGGGGSPRTGGGGAPTAGGGGTPNSGGGGSPSSGGGGSGGGG